MNIKSSFRVAASPQQAWSLLTNLERVAPCFPGAELGEALGDGTYKAGFRVKLGPVSLNFSGKVGFVELDQDRGLAVLKASGNDTKGRGGAQGTVRCRLAADGGGTHVDMDSSVDLSGSVAQYGRGQGMIADLTQQLVDRFAGNLEQLTLSSTQPVQDESNRQPTPADSKPGATAADQAQVGGMVAGALWRALKRFFARLFGAAH